MINKINTFSYILILTLPFTLITGPAIPDLSITLVSILFISILFFDKKISYLKNKNFIKYSVFFWIFLLIISFFAENKYLSYRDGIIFLRILLIPIFLKYWILLNYKRIYYLSFIILIAVLFVCLDTIYQFTNYDPINGFGKDIFGFTPDWYGRLTGPFKDELIPGAFVSKFSLIGLIFLFSFKKNKYQKISITFYLALVGIVCYISGERMSLATFFLAIFILIFFLKKWRFPVLFSLIVILISCFLINKLHPFYNDFKIIESNSFHLGLKVEKEYKCGKDTKEKCKKIIDLQPEFIKILQNFQNSAYGQIYKLGFRMWIDHPIQGIGLNNYYYLCKNDSRYKDSIVKYIDENKFIITDCVSHPHNIYLQWLVETGIIGLFLFLVYLFILFFMVLKKGINNYSIIAFANLAVLFWPIMSTGSLLKNWNGVSTFIIVGICISLSSIYYDEKRIN